ncbi:hypothetical protein [Chitinilyticum piscinae]|uniref:Uncharacterized protein n=1 Tax=Chitinilyticum piscinae TaxID=2866724 RepID=A0A8J7K1L3_9NEIS|nr:hypothetical protein [Chitinilyticum piscinae]MBE9609386.1 hypothetical protein [Chitinilyticum piscinae]
MNGRYWLQLPPQESIEHGVAALMASLQEFAGGRVAAVEGHAVLISNLRVWENLALPAWYHFSESPDAFESHVGGMLEALDWDEARQQQFTGSLPQALSAADRRVAQLLRGLLLQPAALVADAEWWRLLGHGGDLAALYMRHAQNIPLLVVSHGAPAEGFAELETGLDAAELWNRIKQGVVTNADA